MFSSRLTPLSMTGGNVVHEIEDKVGENDWPRVPHGTRIHLRILYLL